MLYTGLIWGIVAWQSTAAGFTHAAEEAVEGFVLEFAERNAAFFGRNFHRPTRMPAEKSHAFFRRQLFNCIRHGQYYRVNDPIAECGLRNAD